MDALGHCPSRAAIALAEATLSDPALKASALISLAKLKSTSILPICQRLIYSGNEIDFLYAIRALRQLGTRNAISLIIGGLRSGPTDRARLSAARALAQLGVATGVELLESELVRLRNVLARSGDIVPEAKISLSKEFVRLALCLTGINNRNALLSLKESLNTRANSDEITQVLKGLTLGILKLRPDTEFEDWKQAMEQWLDDKLALTGKAGGDADRSLDNHQ
jgi:hypothetical protein